jgi:hypothetical protein
MSRGLSEPTNAPIDLIVPILGDVSVVARRLHRALRSIPPGDPLIRNVVCVLDGDHWKTLPMLQVLPFHDPRVVLVEGGPPRDLPGVLLNRGLERVTAPFVALLWAGTEYDPERFERLHRLIEGDRELAMVYSRLKRSWVTCTEANWVTWLGYGQLQYGDLVSAHGGLIRSSALKRIGGFDVNPVFQAYPAWEMMVRLAREHSIRALEPADLGPLPEPDDPDEAGCRHDAVVWDWEDYPFLRTLPFSKDVIHRLVLRTDRRGALSPDNSGETEATQLPILPDGERRKITSFARAAGVRVSAARGDRPLRVAVTGGFWEYIHNQLCFYNFFETDRGLRDFDWRCVYGDDIRPRDVEDCDLVIISRGRCEPILQVIEHCRSTGIPTLYMLDDNWFTVGEDWPIYRDTFRPGQPAYENFLQALRRCDAVLCFNEILADHIHRYNANVVTMRPNINLVELEAIEPGLSAEFVVGFAGSPRQSEVAFEAAAEFVAATPHTRFLYFGVAHPETLERLSIQNRLLHLPYCAYGQYRRRLKQIAPHVLLAPLDTSTFSKSKVFNKYLDITAAGAAGIYSGIEPYTQVVRHSHNGFLVPPDDNDNPAAWFAAIRALYEAPQERASLVRQATAHVREHYETHVVYDEFLALIRSVASRGEVPSGTGAREPVLSCCSS